MTRYARQLQQGQIQNPFPGIVVLEQMLGHAITARIGSNEGLPLPNEAVAQTFSAVFCELARLYPDPSARALRELVAVQQGVAIEEVLFDAGADALILLALRSCCDAGDAVVVTAGTYPTFKYFAEGVAARVIEVPYRDKPIQDMAGQLLPDLAALAEQAHAHQAKLVYLANPDNPTGYYHDRAAIKAFRDALPADTVLLLDEAYIDFCAPDSPSLEIANASSSSPSREYANTVRLRTLSKAYAAAGLRLGYALADAEWVTKANSLRIQYAISNVAQAAGVLLLQDVAYKERLIKETVALRQQLAERLQGASSGRVQLLPSATNFLAVRYADAETAAAIQRQLWQLQAAVHRPPHPAVQYLLRVTAHPQALDDRIIRLLTCG